MFTLALSSLTASNLPWFMYLILHVPVQHCSLEHQTLLSAPDTSVTKHHFCFGLAASLFLELLFISLHSSPAAYWTPSYRGGGSHLPVTYLLHFHTIHGVLAKNTRVVCHSLLQWTTFCQNSSLWSVHLGWPSMVWVIASLNYASPSPWQVCGP